MNSRMFLVSIFLAVIATANGTLKTQYIQFSNKSQRVPDQVENFATLKSPTTGELPSHGFTICGSSFISFFRGQQAFYTLRQNDHTSLWFSLYISIQDIREQTYRPMFTYNGGSVYPNTGAKLTLKPHSWSHACTVINMNSGLVIIVINGQVLFNVTLKSQQLKDPPSKLENNLVLGVSQYKSKGAKGLNFQSEASVANINIFSIPQTILTMITTTTQGSCTHGDFLSWSETSWNLEGNVIRKESSKMCLTSHFPNLYLLPKIFHSQPDCAHLCPRLHPGGRIPLTANRSESQHLAQQYRNMSQDFDSQNSDWIWSSFVFKSERHFNDLYTEIPMENDQWKLGQPNGGNTQQCTNWPSSYPDGNIHDAPCTLSILDPIRCVCQFDKNPILKLRGLCKSSYIDTHYTLKYYANGTVIFLGLVGTEITYEKYLWQLRVNLDDRKASTRATEHPFTMGKHEWTIESDSEKCRDSNLQKRLLKMSGCSEGQFTCSNGDCIMMTERCDEMLNCKDGSDEEDCKTVVLEKSYRKVAPPALLGADNEVIPADVQVSFTLLDISAIREAQNEIDIKFTTELQWTEPRATYYNLKEDISQNNLDKSEAIQLWIPNLIYRNNKDNDDIMSGFSKSEIKIERMGNFTRSGIESVDEIDIFGGKNNPIIMLQSYTKVFKCNYNLIAFPFDTQVIDNQGK